MLPFFSKILERLTYNRLISYIDKHSFLSQNQYGFRKNRSTHMAILSLFDTLVANNEKGEMTAGVFIDLSKAFDTINHEILIKKLERYGIRGIFNSWFKNYLENRTQFVTHNSAQSNMSKVLCGVPQGSILGPLLFILYIDDLTKVSTILNLVLFADDTSIFYNNKDISILKQTINDELAKINDWFKVNKLSLNSSKTHYMLFGQRNINQNIRITLNNNHITKVTNTKFLGVIIDDKLTWKDHIKYTSARVSRGIGILHKARKYLPTFILPSLYSTLVLPYIQYCNIIWAKNYHTRLSPLFLLQKRAIRIINNAGFYDHTAPLFKKTKQLTIYDINKLQIGNFMYKLTHINSTMPTNFNHLINFRSNIHEHNTRGRSKLNTIQHRTIIRSFSISVAGPALWNSLTPSLQSSISDNSFKNKYKKMLLQSY